MSSKTQMLFLRCISVFFSGYLGLIPCLKVFFKQMLFVLKCYFSPERKLHELKLFFFGAICIELNIISIFFIRDHASPKFSGDVTSPSRRFRAMF